ncbi:hypothetical protein CMQ_6144 [Grosmannia clavigera kw1407]|uniref:Uncharacterized protein n=1 Tax=Grosmannia clavigera (strain kw1407 / UAMH 11150) TaxID=655863 RepID=F0XMD8_GROCL|nr:uncharacterized protein CMQ_6144 [Grosmannia clavigera kw1407]EFX01202.1 hypothetical protein CMQ_6144 [Grosmannia clavigera kw1407]
MPLSFIECALLPRPQRLRPGVCIRPCPMRGGGPDSSLPLDSSEAGHVQWRLPAQDVVETLHATQGRCDRRQEQLQWQLQWQQELSISAGAGPLPEGEAKLRLSQPAAQSSACVACRLLRRYNACLILPQRVVRGGDATTYYVRATYGVLRLRITGFSEITYTIAVGSLTNAPASRRPLTAGSEERADAMVVFYWRAGLSVVPGVADESHTRIELRGFIFTISSTTESPPLPLRCDSLIRTGVRWDDEVAKPQC